MVSQQALERLIRRRAGDRSMSLKLDSANDTLEHEWLVVDDEHHGAFTSHSPCWGIHVTQPTIVGSTQVGYPPTRHAVVNGAVNLVSTPIALPNAFDSGDAMRDRHASLAPIVV